VFIIFIKRVLDGACTVGTTKEDKNAVQVL